MFHVWIIKLLATILLLSKIVESLEFQEDLDHHQQLLDNNPGNTPQFNSLISSYCSRISSNRSLDYLMAKLTEDTENRQLRSLASKRYSKRRDQAVAWQLASAIVNDVTCNNRSHAARKEYRQLFETNVFGVSQIMQSITRLANRIRQCELGVFNVFIFRCLFRRTSTTSTTSTTTTTTTTTSTTRPSTTTTPLPTTCTTSGCGDCIGVTSAGGTIQSPNYPDDYGGNDECIYSISARAGSKIRITFTTFIVENISDNLIVYDGPSTLSPLIAQLTGYSLPSAQLSSSNKVTLKFTSDADNSLLDENLKPGRWEATFTII